MLSVLSEPALAALVGLFGGSLLGLAARFGRFCTLGAIEDALYQGSTVRLRMWGVAIGVAVIGSFLLSSRDLINAGASMYLALAWHPLASILGGLVFGYGMALAGNCGFGALARLGGGDLRSFVIVLVMGITAYITVSGPLAAWRVAIWPADPGEVRNTGIAHLISHGTGLSVTLIGVVLGIAILLGALASREFLKSPKTVFWSVVVGLAIVSGWLGTTWLEYESFGEIPVSSHTFSSPLGETILYLMTSSGGGLSFGVGSVAGVLLGAFVGSLIKGHFRWEACEDPRELRRQIIGAALMGVGAVVAMGCTVGQGLSAFSLLAISAPVTMAAVFAGAAFGLRQLIEGFAIAE
ncbi:MAG: YeeE/YedE family protein [Rhodobacteraceae bacterium]|nr:YeeE/YedE family protein [Paracoccaceae bacterium]